MCGGRYGLQSTQNIVNEFRKKFILEFLNQIFLFSKYILFYFFQVYARSSASALEKCLTQRLGPATPPRPRLVLIQNKQQGIYMIVVSSTIYNFTLENIPAFCDQNKMRKYYSYDLILISSKIQSIRKI